MWQILIGLFASTEKMVPLGWLHNREAQHWDFNVFPATCGYLFPLRRRKISNGGNRQTLLSGESQLP